ncbi:MAG: polyribonucleotide nucleotidyltransferase [Deltaproteobacteria bacterium]|nr:MAG: polyribonucleotide nucleotidyltransferase [Deltaproteobacteria bacterium]
MTVTLSSERPIHSTTLSLGDATIALETGQVARQADAAVVLREKRTVILAALVTEPLRQLSRSAYLTVEYRERMAAVGRIPGNYFRRELRPGEHEILMNRTIDRCLRPLIPHYYDRSIQLQVTVFSADPESDIATLSTLAACATMGLSPVPTLGVALGARLVQSEGEWSALRVPGTQNPVESDVFVALSEKGLLTVEGGGHALSSDDVQSMVEAVERLLNPALLELSAWCEELRPDVFPWSPLAFPDELVALVEPYVSGTFENLEDPSKRRVREVEFGQSKRRAVEALCGTLDDDEALPVDDVLDEEDVVESDDSTEESDESSQVSDSAKVWEPQLVRALFDHLVEKAVRENLCQGVRLDGRSSKEHRPIEAMLGFLPMNHGSTLLTRGETQALVSVTVGRLGEGQNVETLEGQNVNHFLVHYNFPGYATGHIARFRPPGFREHGHGHLARRALLPMLPNLYQWGKSVRVVSDITESSGSSSMATVCGASLALMDAGVPLAGHVAGLAVGLVREEGQAVILSDISEEEDTFGDMDLKLTTTRQGITAIQLDMKNQPLPLSTFLEAIAQGSETLAGVLTRLEETIESPRDVEIALPSGKGGKSQRNKDSKKQGKPETKPQDEGKAPSSDSSSSRKPPEEKKVEEPAFAWQLDYQVDASMVGRVIGSRGRNIRAVEAALPVEVKASNEGVIALRSDSQEALLAARHQVKAFLLTLHKDERYLGVVVGSSEEHVEVRIGDHVGHVPLSQWKELSGEPQPHQEVLVCAAGSDSHGKLRLRMMPSNEEELAKAQNYVEEPGLFQNLTNESPSV